jgi:hypothetical protein
VDLLDWVCQMLGINDSGDDQCMSSDTLAKRLVVLTPVVFLADANAFFYQQSGVKKHPPRCAGCPIFVAISLGAVANEKDISNPLINSLGLSILGAQVCRITEPGFKGAQWVKAIDSRFILLTERQTAPQAHLLAQGFEDDITQHLTIDQASDWLRTTRARFRPWEIILVGHDIRQTVKDVKKIFKYDLKE